MARSAVVYVTRSGHSRAIAETVAARLDARPSEIVDLVPRKGLFGYIRSGAQATRGKATPIQDPAVNLSEAESVILVQPVWASSVCPPLRTWLNGHKTELAGKKVALVLSSKGSEGEAVKAKYESEFGPLAAFACIHENDPQSDKDAAIGALCGALTR